MDGSVDAATSAEGGVGGIDDRVDLQDGDVSLDGADLVVELLVRGWDELLGAGGWAQVHRSVERGDGWDVLHGSERWCHGGEAEAQQHARDGWLGCGRE